MIRTHRMLALAALVSVAACDDGSPTTPEAQATITGRIESTTAINAAAPAASPQAQPAAEASTVAVAAVASSGALEVLAEAEVRSGGRFTIENVPVGRSDLVVSARSATGAEVGRALVHGQTEQGATITVEPMNGETTVEGLVLSRLRAAGVGEAVVSTVELALMIRMGDATGAEVAASAQAIGSVADAVSRGVEARDRALAALGAQVDGAALGAAMRAAAQEYVENRDGGAAPGAAHRALVEAFLDGLRGAGASAEQAALATTAAAVGMDRAMAAASDRARLDVARAAVEMNLEAREDLLATLPASSARDRAAEGLARAQAAVDAAGSHAELRAALGQAAAEADAAVQAELLDAILARLGNVPAEVRERIEARLREAFSRSAVNGLGAVGGQPEDIAAAIAQFRAEVRAAVEALVEAAQSGGLDADATAALLVVVKGGPFGQPDA